MGEGPGSGASVLSCRWVPPPPPSSCLASSRKGTGARKKGAGGACVFQKGPAQRGGRGPSHEREAGGASARAVCFVSSVRSTPRQGQKRGGGLVCGVMSGEERKGKISGGSRVGVGQKNAAAGAAEGPLPCATLAPSSVWGIEGACWCAHERSQQQRGGEGPAKNRASGAGCCTHSAGFACARRGEAEGGEALSRHGHRKERSRPDGMPPAPPPCGGGCGWCSCCCGGGSGGGRPPGSRPPPGA